MYEHYFDRIYRYITLKTGDTDEAEDITQEVFLKALRAINNYRWRGAPLSSWLYRIARNQIVDHMRKRKHYPSVSLDETLANSVYSLDNPQTIVEIRSDVDQLIIAISKLTPAQREVIALRFTSDLSLAQVALLMGKSVGAIKSLQYSAVETLSKRMLIA